MSLNNNKLFIQFLHYQEFLDKRQMTEWGNRALIDDDDDEDGPGKSIALPGVRKGDMSSRHWKPEVRVSCVKFSPTGLYCSISNTCMLVNL